MAQYVSVQQAADDLGVCSKTIRRWIAEGRLTARRAGPRLIRIDRADLARMMDPVGSL